MDLQEKQFHKRLKTNNHKDKKSLLHYISVLPSEIKFIIVKSLSIHDLKNLLLILSTLPFHLDNHSLKSFATWIKILISNVNHKLNNNNKINFKLHFILCPLKNSYNNNDKIDHLKLCKRLFYNSNNSFSLSTINDNILNNDFKSFLSIFTNSNPNNSNNNKNFIKLNHISISGNFNDILKFLNELKTILNYFLKTIEIEIIDFENFENLNNSNHNDNNSNITNETLKNGFTKMNNFYSNFKKFKLIITNIEINELQILLLNLFVKIQNLNKNFNKKYVKTIKIFNKFNLSSIDSLNLIITKYNIIPNEILIKDSKLLKSLFISSNQLQPILILNKLNKLNLNLKKLTLESNLNQFNTTTVTIDELINYNDNEKIYDIEQLFHLSKIYPNLNELILLNFPIDYIKTSGFFKNLKILKIYCDDFNKKFRYINLYNRNTIFNKSLIKLIINSPISSIKIFNYLNFTPNIKILKLNYLTNSYLENEFSNFKFDCLNNLNYLKLNLILDVFITNKFKLNWPKNKNFKKLNFKIINLRNDYINTIFQLLDLNPLPNSIETLNLNIEFENLIKLPILNFFPNFFKIFFIKLFKNLNNNLKELKIIGPSTRTFILKLNKTFSNVAFVKTGYNLPILDIFNLKLPSSSTYLKSLKLKRVSIHDPKNDNFNNYYNKIILINYNYDLNTKNNNTNLQNSYINSYNKDRCSIFKNENIFKYNDSSTFYFHSKYLSFNSNTHIPYNHLKTKESRKNRVVNENISKLNIISENGNEPIFKIEQYIRYENVEDEYLNYQKFEANFNLIDEEFENLKLSLLEKSLKSIINTVYGPKSHYSSRNSERFDSLYSYFIPINNNQNLNLKNIDTLIDRIVADRIISNNVLNNYIEDDVITNFDVINSNPININSMNNNNRNINDINNATTTIPINGQSEELRDDNSMVLNTIEYERILNSRSEYRFFNKNHIKRDFRKNLFDLNSKKIIIGELFLHHCFINFHQYNWFNVSEYRFKKLIFYKCKIDMFTMKFMSLKFLEDPILESILIIDCIFQNYKVMEEFMGLLKLKPIEIIEVYNCFSRFGISYDNFKIHKKKLDDVEVEIVEPNYDHVTNDDYDYDNPIAENIRRNANITEDFYDLTNYKTNDFEIPITTTKKFKKIKTNYKIIKSILVEDTLNEEEIKRQRLNFKEYPNIVKIPKDYYYNVYEDYCNEDDQVSDKDNINIGGTKTEKRKADNDNDEYYDGEESDEDELFQSTIMNEDKDKWFLEVAKTNNLDFEF